MFSENLKDKVVRCKPCSTAYLHISGETEKLNSKRNHQKQKQTNSKKKKKIAGVTLVLKCPQILL